MNSQSLSRQDIERLRDRALRLNLGFQVQQAEALLAKLPVTEPVDDERYLLNTVTPERFWKPSTGWRHS